MRTAHWGFVDLPHDPRHAMIVRKSIGSTAGQGVRRRRTPSNSDGSNSTSLNFCRYRLYKRSSTRKIRKLSDRDAPRDHHMIYAEMGERVVLSQVPMGEQGADRGERRALTPDRPSERKPVGAGGAADDARTHAPGAYRRNERERGDTDRGKAIGAVLSSSFVGSVGRIARHQGVAHVFVGIPPEREGRIGAPPWLKEGLVKALGCGKRDDALSFSTRRWRRLPRHAGQSLKEMLMALAEQETKLRGIDGLLLIVFNCSVAHQRRQQIDARPRIEPGGFGFLLQEIAALLHRTKKTVSLSVGLIPCGSIWAFSARTVLAVGFQFLLLAPV